MYEGPPARGEVVANVAIALDVGVVAVSDSPDLGADRVRTLDLIG